ncbi:MAG: reverse transcriptase domain-containing protein [Limnohabitans sp.]|nr:reverse transcriptase domain-containing protein [Limnohabitans sp.]
MQGQKNAIISFQKSPFTSLINVPARLNDILDIHVVLDTGASSNVITTSLFEKLNIEYKPYVAPYTVAGGGITNSIGKALIKIKVLDCEDEVEVVVIECREPYFLAGQPFLIRFEIEISYSNNTISCAKSGKTLIFRNKPRKTVSKKSRFLVAASDTVSVPPLSQKYVRISVNSNFIDKNKVFLISPNRDFCFKSSLVIANGIVDPSVASILVANMSNEPVLVYENTILGRLSEISIKESPRINVKPKSILLTFLFIFINLFNLIFNFLKSFLKPFIHLNILSITPLELNINNKLSVKEKQSLTKLLIKYRNLFASSMNELGKFSGIKHVINTEDSLPVKQNPYRTSSKEKNIITETVQELLNAGIIEESSSPWCSPVVIVPKKDGSYRMCIDYRKLNKVTKKDSYPLPRIDDALDTLAGSKFYSSLDLYSGYFQIEVDDYSKEKTAFRTHDGFYQYNVLPFGLTNAPPTFQRAMDSVLCKLKWNICLVYLDDILIFSRDFDTHLERLELVFNALDEGNLKLKPSKCHFAMPEVSFLGHVIADSGIRPDPSKIEKLQKFEQPKNSKDVLSFLGLINYYRKFVPNLYKLEKPLRNLTLKNAEFVWTDECSYCFDNLKFLLTTSPILAHFDERLPIILKTDASGIGVGVVLSQVHPEGERVVAYDSHCFAKAERNYPTIQKEGLGIMYGLKVFRHYLHGRHFTIMTDHSALIHIQNMNNQNMRLRKWAIMLQEFDFDIMHKKGSSHSDADCLSRYFSETEKDLNVQVEYDPPLLSIVDDDLVSKQREDPFSSKIITNIEKGMQVNPFFIKDSILFKRFVRDNCFKDCIVIPKTHISDVLRHCHDSPLSGHLGVKRTIRRVREKYFWRGMNKDILSYVRSCELCQSKKSPRTGPVGNLKSLTPVSPWYRVGIDILGRFPKSNVGNKYIIVACDHFTKWLEIEAVPNANASTVANFVLYKIILKHGSPQVLLSDRGTQFLSRVVKELCELFKIKKISTSPYHPQTNGQTERHNSTLKDMISMYVNDCHDDWDANLDFIQYAYNSSQHDTTSFTPYFLNHGREVRGLNDYIERDVVEDEMTEYVSNVKDRLETANDHVMRNIVNSQSRNENYVNKNRKENRYKEGDLVSIFRPIPQIGKSQKLLRNWKTNYKIVKVHKNGLSVEVKNNKTNDRLTVNVNNLKPYFKRNELTDEDLSEPNINEVGNDSNLDIALRNTNRNEISYENFTDDSNYAVNPFPNSLRKSCRRRTKPKRLSDYNLY